MEKLDLITAILLRIGECCIQGEHCLFCSGHWTGWQGYEMHFEHHPDCPAILLEKLARKDRENGEDCC